MAGVAAREGGSAARIDFLEVHIGRTRAGRIWWRSIWIRFESIWK